MTQAGFPLPLDGGLPLRRYPLPRTSVPAFFACQCTEFRQLTASAFSLGLAVPGDGFEVVAGTPRVWTKAADSEAEPPMLVRCLPWLDA